MIGDLPGIKITVLNNQLDAVNPSDDHVYGLVLSGVAISGHVLISTPYQVFSMDDVTALTLTAAYDATNTTDVWKQLNDFYKKAPKGTELWFMIIPKTTTMAVACDKANNIVKLLLNAASGRITLWGITRTPDGAYTPGVTTGLDDDAAAAVLTAHALCEDFATNFKPCRFLIGGRDYASVAANLKDFTLNSNNRGSVVLGSTFSTGEPAVAFTLGKFASIPIQRKISRVKNAAGVAEDLGLSAAYLSDGTTIETNESTLNSIHKKGYIIFRKFINKSGYWFSSDPTCCPASDDFASLARGLVIDKMERITYATYVNEIEDDIELDANGLINPSKVKDYQQEIIDAISAAMIPENLSAVTCEIDPAQNVIANNTVQIKRVGGQPKGYSSYININLAFTNPTTA